ncbi:HAD family hydrolase [Actinomyces sp. ZJ308]|uniref:HAD family hydrolase n=1 Tax=Actinomyces sp. ZJ308 TaxID=2708342 RepID=UPI0014215372|nr:HAD family hydrolase [Actinomyces sp. ZJ308]
MSTAAPASVPRTVFLDVDGTLVTYSNVLPDSAVRAIREARDSGHRVYVCTGRSRAEMPETIWRIGLDGMIGGNGAYVEDDGEVLLHQHLSRAQCEKIVSWLRRRGLDFYLEANSGLYAPGTFRETARPAIRAYAAGKGAAGASSMEVDDVFPGMVFTDELVRDDVNKISFLLASPDVDLAAAHRELPGLVIGSWGGSSHEPLFGDASCAGVSKRHAIDVLLAHRDADRRQAVAFGDATVDIEMLEYCGTGVAMGNGSPAVKEAADLVTDDVEADGLARAFERLGLAG